MLTIRVLTYQGTAPKEDLSYDFDVSGGTLGRAPGNQLALPDPEKHISRIHARIVCRDGRFYVVDQGSANRTQLNGRLLDAESEELLNGGDLMTLGEYVLGVSEFLGSGRKAKPEAAVPPPETPPPAESDSFSMFDQVLEGDTGIKPPAVAPTEPADALVRGLLRGLGQPELNLAQGQNGIDEAAMERLGMLLKESVEGVLRLLTARFMAKFEAGAEVTVMAGRDNNPLKFSPDAASALQILLGPLGQGFLAPDKAIRGAFDDLLSHLQGSEAGLKAALDGVVSSFNPIKIEERLSEKSMLDNLLPMNRRARLWDLFTERYQEFSKEAETDFRVLFDRAYLRAYEEAVEKCRSKV